MKGFHQDVRVKSPSIQVNYRFTQSSCAAPKDEVWRALSVLAPCESVLSETQIRHNKMMDALHRLHIER